MLLSHIMQPREVQERIQQSTKIVGKGWRFNPETGEIIGAIGEKVGKFVITQHTIFDPKVWEAWWQKKEINLTIHDRVGLVRIAPVTEDLKAK